MGDFKALNAPDVEEANVKEFREQFYNRIEGLHWLACNEDFDRGFTNFLVRDALCLWVCRANPKCLCSQPFQTINQNPVSKTDATWTPDPIKSSRWRFTSNKTVLTVAELIGQDSPSCVMR